MARRYVRDARGRFASAGVGGLLGYQGQTSGRGARLKTPGNVRAGGGAKQKLSVKPSGTVAKPKGLKPQKNARKELAYARLRAINRKMGDRPDLAQVNIRGRFRGQAGKRMDTSIDRAVKAQKATERAESKARNRQFRSDQSRAKKLRSVHETAVATSFAKRHGKKVADVRATIRGMTAPQQIKLFKLYVKENRKTAAKR